MENLNLERIGYDTTKSISAFEIYREIIQENIDYTVLIRDRRHCKDRIDELVDPMLETICTSKKTLRIAGDTVY